MKRQFRGKLNFSSLLVQGDLGIFFAVLIFGAMLTIYSGKFLSSTNIFAISRAFSLWIFVGLAQMSVLVIGHMNLSVGAIGGLASVATGYLFEAYGAPAWLAIIAGLMVGAICGIVNGLIITKTGINAFVITLATASIFSGMVFGLTHAIPFSDIPDTFKIIGRGGLFNKTIPILFFIMIGISFLLWILFSHSIVGRRILATGGNIETAKLSGINTNNIIIFAHMLSGLLAGLGGVMFVARLGSAQPTIGMNWLLMSFAIPIVGGTALQGGKTSILGVIFGGILMTMISNGLVLLRVDTFWEQFFLGLLLLTAVGIDRVRAIYAEKRV